MLPVLWSLIRTLHCCGSLKLSCPPKFNDCNLILQYSLWSLYAEGTKDYFSTQTGHQVEHSVQNIVLFTFPILLISPKSVLLGLMIKEKDKLTFFELIILLTCRSPFQNRRGTRPALAWQTLCHEQTHSAQRPV